jgi:alpha-tubulin suppressor-like RCC1 family protein
MDTTCADTATCPPSVVEDAGQERAMTDGRAPDAPRGDTIDADAPANPAVDVASSDTTLADRVDSGSVGDASTDRSTTADAATHDADANARDAGSASDASQDGRTAIEGSTGEIDVRADRDVSVGIDASDGRLPDGNGGSPDASGSTDSSAIDATDASDSPDAVDACTQNPCGGCTVLTGAPGTSCGSCGTYVCNSADSVKCNDPGANACGGCAVLAGVPQTACGTCGTYTCNGPDSVACSNDAPLNACGGCGVLAAAPGASCGSCGKYTCNADKASVYCDHPDPLKVTQLAAGYFHTCALLSNGAVRCWGYNGFGQLGDSSTATRLTPTGNVLTGAVAIGGGWSHACAIMSSGGLRCWGYNANGELGDGLGGTGTSDNDRHSPPSNDIAGLSNVTAVSLGLDQSCVISAGNAYCWGANYAGQLGDMGGARNAPGPALLGGVSAVGAGQSVTCAIAGGQVGCWGQHADEFQLAGLAGSIFVMPSRGGYGCAIDTQGALRCFSGTELTSSLLGNVSSVGVGHGHICAVSNGDVRCWGANNWGQLGEPSSMTPSRTGPDGPVIVQGATAVVAGNEHTCALLSSGSVRCWGIVYTSTSIESPPTDVTGFCP